MELRKIISKRLALLVSLVLERAIQILLKMRIANYVHPTI